ncbi:TadE/TadG family type IV pilus assembly protein [Polynucleobacter sp. MWH-Braz-FAM2G]|uniref:TadE/TadG family type IV pilus assembly protein n=1 Tax=Polynucleobacter sp. MWH-Braz-FAM2G TaxID=1855883 RepID=UPI001BFDEE65|nr:TadE/TadG family type IV pilus assembly protein [Polynucleobacter sp. MWH-Braz-FAM2G]QWD89942.1 pilus assembly protein [Polynucleobacter sp. MWH-Braz-FAM2G]
MLTLVSRLKKNIASNKYALIICEKATIAIETALLLPVLLLMVFGGIQMTGMYYDYMLISSAATEAARQGMLSSTTSTMTAYTMGTIVNSYLTNSPLITFGGTASNLWTARVYVCKATITNNVFSTTADTSAACTTGEDAKLTASTTVKCPLNDANRATNYPNGALLKVNVSYQFVGFWKNIPGSTNNLSYTAQMMCE